MNKSTLQRSLPFLVAILIWGCSGERDQIIVDDGKDAPTIVTTTCIGCHSSEEALKASVPASAPATLVRGPEVPPPGMSDG